MHAPPGRILSQNDWPKKTQKLIHHHKTQDFEPRGRAVFLVSPTLLISALGIGIFPIKSLALSHTCFFGQFISECQTRVPFQALEGSPFLQHLKTRWKHLITSSQLGCVSQRLDQGAMGPPSTDGQGCPKASFIEGAPAWG